MEKYLILSKNGQQLKVNMSQCIGSSCSISTNPSVSLEPGQLEMINYLRLKFRKYAISQNCKIDCILVSLIRNYEISNQIRINYFHTALPQEKFTCFNEMVYGLQNFFLSHTNETGIQTMVEEVIHEIFEYYLTIQHL